MPRVPGNRNGSGTENQPVSERERSRSKSGDDRDKAKYDNGRVRYDWDIYTDDRGDNRGKVGVGHRDERNDIYGSLEFNEKTDRVKGNLEYEREVNENLDLRGAYGRDSDSNNSGRLGGRARGDDGWVDLQMDFNEKTDRLDGRMKSRYKVSDKTTGRLEYTARNKKSDSWEVGAKSRTGVGDYVDGEVGSGLSMGGYGAGRWVRKDEGELVDDHWVRYSEKKGLEIKSKGHREGENWEADHKLTRAKGVTKHKLTAEHEGENATHTLRTNFEHDAKNRTSGDITVGREGEDYGAAVRLRKDKSGLKKARITGEKAISDDTTLGGRLDVDEKGRWKAGGTVKHDVNDDVRVKEGLAVDHKGVRYHEHGAEVDFADDKGEVTVGIHHSSDGAHKERVGVNYKTEERDSHRVAVEHRETKTGKVTNKAEYHFSEYEGPKAHLKAGHTDDNRFVAAGVENKINKKTTERFEVEWSDDKGLEGSGAIRREINDGTEVEGRFGGSVRDGNIRASLGVEHKVDEEVSLKAGLSAARKDGKIAGNVGIKKALGDDDLAGGLRVGAGRTNTKIHGDVGGDLTIGNVFGTSTGKIGGDLGLSVTKRVAVKTGRGEAGRLRDEVLADQPEGSGYVRYGLKGKASANVGITLPMGPGYVETGLKGGKSYAVEFTRLEEQPEIGKRPSRADLEVPGTADKLLEMKVGEAVAISGETTHGYMVGGGVGAAMGAVGIGEAGIKAGADVTYTVTGKTRTEVLRGGDSSARMTLRAGDMNTKGAGLKVKVGITPKLPNLGDKIGPVGEVATGLATGALAHWMSVGARKGKEFGEGDDRLMDVRLDLSNEEAKTAYNAAMKGDWSEIKALHTAGHPAVKLEKTILTDIHEKATPLAVHGLGMSFESETREVKKDSKVEVGDREFKVVSDKDIQSREKDGWFVDRKTEVVDYSRTVTPEEGTELGRIKGEEHYLSWTTSKTDSFTSKEEVSEQLELAKFVIGSEDNKDLTKYSKKIDKLDNHRKLWIGPRNELRKTSVSTSVTISDAGLDRLESKTEGEIWSAFATAKNALNEPSDQPAWTDAQKRAGLANGTGSFRVSSGAMFASSPGIQYDQALFEQASDFVDGISAASKLPEEQRNDAVRETLAKFKDDPATIGAMVELLGRDVVRMDLKIDSDAGRKKKQFDLKLSVKGEDYQVHKTTFGEEL